MVTGRAGAKRGEAKRHSTFRRQSNDDQYTMPSRQQTGVIAMPTALVCPNCRTNFEIASDSTAAEPVRCGKCMHTFLRSDAVGFQAGPAPITVTPIDDDDDE